MARPRPRSPIPTSALRVIPDGVSERDALLAEPATTVLGGLYRVGDVQGRRTLVIGAGTIGLIAAQVFRHAGALVDIAVRHADPERSLDGVTTLEVSRRGRQPPSRIATTWSCARRHPRGRSRLAIAAVANGGVIVLLGVPGERIDDVDIASVLHKDATLHGVLNYSSAGPGTMDRALALIAEGVIDPGPVIDSVYPLDRVAEAFERARDPGRHRPQGPHRRRHHRQEPVMYLTRTGIPVEIPFEVHLPDGVDPFNDVDVDVEFIDTDGGTVLVPAFWAGDRSFRVRYASSRPGRFELPGAVAIHA